MTWLRDRPGEMLALRAARAWGVSPDDYAEWSDRARGLAEASILADATTNKYGIDLELARDFEVGFDVKFVKDYSEEAVRQAIKSEYGDKGLPPGVSPVVSVNQKSMERRARSRGDATAPR